MEFMSFADFQESIRSGHQPSPLSLPLQALWHDARGDWEKAHELAQQAKSTEGDRVHAYLHRKEGDEENAGYWYLRAGKTKSEASIEDEWQELVVELLAKK
jgi:hypothetical protein